MQKRPFLCPDKETSTGKKKQATISSEESFSIPKRSPQRPSEEYPPNTKGITRCLARRSRKDYPNTPFGIMPLNYSLEPLHHYRADSFPSPRAKLLKHKSS